MNLNPESSERPDFRPALRAPSHWDIVLAPELAPLFVLDAAILMVEHIFAISLDTSSSDFGGAGYPPTQQMRAAMQVVRQHIRLHRRLWDGIIKHRAPIIEPDDSGGG